MNASFDTLAAARELESGGFDDKQAAVLLKVMRMSGESTVTKSDLALVKSDLSRMDESLRREIVATRVELRSSIAELRTEIASTAGEVRAEIASITVELRAEIASTTVELRGEIATAKAELRADMNAMANKMLLSQLAVAGLLFAAIKTFT